MHARIRFATAPALLTAYALALAALAPAAARAHCDTMDGPVIKVAQRALATGELSPVLAWVKPTGEAEVKAAFEKTLAVRKLNPTAQELADNYFFETLVRVHRAGEGAPYTGIQPAGTPIDASVMAADHAIETGQLGEVTEMLAAALKGGLNARFARVRALQPPADDVADGREYVEAYVGFIHYVEGVQAAVAGGSGENHEATAQEAAAHAH